MEAYDSDQDPSSDHNLKSDHKGESDQDVNSDESRDARPETPSKKLVRQSLKPKKKAQLVRGLKGQFEAMMRTLNAIQAQTAMINQKCESQAISTKHLAQQVEDINQEFLAQGERTRRIEDDFYEDKDHRESLEPEEGADMDDDKTTELDDDDFQDDEKQYSEDEQGHPKSKKSKRKPLKYPVLDIQRQKVDESTPLLHSQLTAETMIALIKETMAGELGTMRQRMDQIDKGNQPYIPDLGSEELPLPYTEAIMFGKTSKNTKFQKIDLYDGSADPYDHLDNFRSTMDNKDATEADRCKAFPQTLKGSALNWFRRISANTIRSFGELRRTFLDEFMIVSNRVYTPNDLTQIHQLPEESLRDYVIRFQGNYYRCEGADEKIAFAALMGGFRSSPFLFKIMQDPPSSFKDLIREATNYSRAENLNHSRSLDVNPQPSVGTKRNSSAAFGTETFANNSKEPQLSTDTSGSSSSDE